VSGALIIASERGDVGLPAGTEILAAGGSALDAVEAAVREVESNPDDHFVGIGGLPNLLGVVELDASIMDGRRRAAGAAAVRGYAHPISIVRRVMERLPQHVLLVGDGAERFAAEMGFEPEDPLTAEAARMWREETPPPLRTADELLGPIILYEAWQLHRGRYEADAAGYGPGTRQLLEMGSQVTEAEYRDALLEREHVGAAVAELFAGVDVLAGPTAAYQAPAEDPPVGTPEGNVESRFTGPWNVIRMPVISLPCAMPDGELPAGLQLGAAAGADDLLLSVAAAAEAVMLA
jgi:hypothetical protein